MVDGLNPAQLDAVNHLAGPCLVLAGAGSGKTRVITHKIARLLQTGTEARRIAAITFTNKAAAEMRERTRQLAGKGARDVTLCTFHALGVRLLREDGEAIGLKPRFSILDSDDALAILKDLAATTDKAEARRRQWGISAWKAAGLSPRDAATQASGPGERELAVLYGHYEERLSAFQSVDFDDLIALPLKLLRQHEAVRSRWQQTFAHVLVDEYQDTNASQYELLRLLVGERGRFTAVGDDDQSIYGWRGATLDNLKRLPQDYPRLRVIKLEQNYRSTGAILRAANAVIGANPKLYPKTLWSDLGEGEPVRVRECDHEDHEAERAVAFIQSLRGSARAREWRDFAILYRANHQARVFEQALRRAQIPYKVSGGQSFFDRAEIKDLCAWLRLLVNPSDDPAFLRAATTPRRGIGQQTLQQLAGFAAASRTSLMEALRHHAAEGAVGARGLASLKHFAHELHDLAWQAAQTAGTAAARGLLTQWLDALGYRAHLESQAESPALAEARWSNVQDFCDWMARRCAATDDTPGAPQQTLIDVAQTVALVSSLSEREPDNNVVTLSTLHAAKGLEWPHVVLAGVNEGLLPFKPSDENATPDALAQRLAEERRLMYVGITRAREHLMVSWLRRRKRGREVVAGQPSRFIAEMALDQAVVKEDPLQQLRALRDKLAAKT